MAVFAPVLTIKEETGQLFYDIALAICASVLLSLVVSVSVVPMAAAKLLGHRRAARGPLVAGLYSLFGLARFFSWGNDAFARLVHAMTFPSLAGAWLREVVIAAVTGVAVALSWLLMLPASYLPDGNKNLTRGMMFNPPGYSLQQNTSVAERLEAAVQPYWEASDSEEARPIAPLADMQTGKPIDRVPALDEFFFVVSRGRVMMMTTSKDPENVRPVKAILTRAMNQIPGSYGIASQQSIFGRNAGGSNAVEVEVVGTTCRGYGAARHSRRSSREFSKFAVRSDPMISTTGPERQIVIDQVLRQGLGLNVESLARGGPGAGRRGGRRRLQLRRRQHRSGDDPRPGSR